MNMTLEMKKYFTLLIVFCITSSITGLSQAQGSEKAVSQAIEVEAIESQRLLPGEYQSNAEYWKDRVTIDPSDENAWISWYKSERYKNYTAKSKIINPQSQKILDDILIQMKVAVPTSFAMYYASYLNGNKSNESFEDLKKAISMKPDEPELLDDMIAMNVINGNTEQTKIYCQKIKSIDPYSAAETEYNRNVLNSLEPNAILLTNGNVDTYPIIIDQQLSGMRTDVTVVCLDWMSNHTYAETVAEKAGVSESTMRGVSAGNALDKIVNSKTTSPIYMSLTLSPDQIEKYKKNLYLTGLAMKYSPLEIENIPALVYNWENLFSKTQINARVELNRNYLFPLLQLHAYYKRIGDVEKQNQTKDYILRISELTGQKEKLTKMLD